MTKPDIITGYGFKDGKQVFIGHIEMCTEWGKRIRVMSDPEGMIFIKLVGGFKYREKAEDFVSKLVPIPKLTKAIKAIEDWVTSHATIDRDSDYVHFLLFLHKVLDKCSLESMSAKFVIHVDH